MKIRDFRSNDEIYALLTAFESGELSLADFKHAAHIAVGHAYLARARLPQATDTMRASLKRFLAHHDTVGFHETQTVFWMKLIDHATAAGDVLPLWQRVNRFTVRYGGKWPVEAHYSKALISSALARDEWVEPDLLPIPF